MYIFNALLFGDTSCLEWLHDLFIHYLLFIYFSFFFMYSMVMYPYNVCMY